MTGSQSSGRRARKVLLLGSGGLQIGQAGEFDYSGNQAIKSMREAHCEVIVVNPNIATVQTNPQPGVKIYLYPLEPHWVEKIIERERPDGIVAGFGGQTAINCLIALHDQGTLEKFGVQNLGSPVDVLKTTEDRDLFAQKMTAIGQPVLESISCDTLADARLAAAQIGFPVIVRAGYALGGLGSGFADTEEQLDKLVAPALASSPHVLVEKSLRGWKEVEYEVMRDTDGNCIAICNMENFDPLGIHTGDSIVVCPSQTLTDEDFHTLRTAALNIVDSCGVIGECNVQFALNPEALEYFVIEVNARLSRSSALASKASGYPIAAIAAKAVLGISLLAQTNPVTGITCAFYEPALDYITMKVPRWDFEKFPSATRTLDSTMKSVGEVMSIGRSFNEVLQKAVRMVQENDLSFAGATFFQDSSDGELDHELRNATDKRLFAIHEAFFRGWSVDHVRQSTRVGVWFLEHIREICRLEAVLRDTAESDRHRSMSELLGDSFMKELKLNGFSDMHIGACLSEEDASSAAVKQRAEEIRLLRKSYGIVPRVKRIDTTAAEFPSPSNYLFLTYHAEFDDDLPALAQHSALVLGGGAYRIGASVEFDWCAVGCSERLRKEGWGSIVLNCNPETVSTDYNASDRLYFEELSLERILDIADREKPFGVVACVGGQLPNKLASDISRLGLRLLGHSHETIQRAENRELFSSLLDELGIDQPRWVNSTSMDEATDFVSDVGFPVIIRPSFVLSGAAMKVAFDRKSLEDSFAEAVLVSDDHPVVISQFIEGAREIELDGVARNGVVVKAIVSEHIENAGIHSGDATMVVPAQTLQVETVRRVRRAGRQIAQALGLNGPFNIQFLAKNQHIRVIECNARASRSFPFVSKVLGTNLIDFATRVILGQNPNPTGINEDDLPHVGVKAAMFSFTRLSGVDPVLGVEMASTGEVGCLGHNFPEALLLALEATGCKIPRKGVLVSSGTEREKYKFLEAARVFSDLGLPLFGTEGSSRFLQEHGIDCTTLVWPGEGPNNCLDAIRDRKVDLVINIPKNVHREELTHDTIIRKAAAEFGCSILTNMEKVVAFASSIPTGEHAELCTVPDFLDST